MIDVNLTKNDEKSKAKNPNVSKHKLRVMQKDEALFLQSSY